MLLSLISGDILAQEDNTSVASTNKWAFLVEPYMLFPNMKGSVGLGVLPDAPIDANTNDIFGNLKWGLCSIWKPPTTPGLWARTLFI